MIIKSVRVKRLCGILDATLECDSLTALVGGNGCGKSTFLRAINLFYQPSPRITGSDFYNDDAALPIEITISFVGLSSRALQLFSKYVQKGTLTVTRVLTLLDNRTMAKYHGARLQHPEFAPVRLETSKTEQKKRYDELRASHRFTDLPTVRSADAALAELEKYESSHQDECRLQRDDGQFFGFDAVGVGYLGQFTRFLLIPAVRDAATDSADSRGAPITELMDLVVRGALADRDDLTQLKAEVSSRYRDIVDPANLPELDRLEHTLTENLRKYVPDAAINIDWSAATEIEMPMPRATVKLVEHSYPSVVTNAGHGLQRAFVLTLLQSLTAARSNQEWRAGEVVLEAGGPGWELPDLVLAIEEPELFQHPPRQRHFASILYSLANDPIPGVAQKTQVIYTTHSAHFIGLDRFEQVRVCHKVENGPGFPQITQVKQVTMDDVAAELSHTASGSRSKEQNTWERLRPRIQTIMTPLINEGFFADVVVLVEGDEDRSAILTMARLQGIGLDEQGILVIPCSGKTNLPAPSVIFRQFGIRTYVIWDGDNPNPSEAPKNNQLLQLLGQPAVGFPGTRVNATFACFDCKLGDTLRDEFDRTAFDGMVTDCVTNLGLRNGVDSHKNPMVVAQCIEKAYEQGLRSITLEQIVEKIQERKEGGRASL